VIYCLLLLMRLLLLAVHRWSGVLYLTLSMISSIVYIELIKDSMANDLFWPNMSPAGAQMYLTQAFSQHLFMNEKKILDIFDPSSAIIEKSNVLVSQTLWPSYPRTIVYGKQFSTIQSAIQGFRQFDASYTFSLSTQYCWVDFDRRWEIAHTINRQSRCYERYKTNGAVYLEAILRNVDWDEWSSAYYPSFMQGVGNSLIKSSQGQAWLASVPNVFKSIDSEVEFWTDKGIVNFVLQWHNRIQTGLSESITVVNVFGANQPLTTYHVAHSARGPKWTSSGLYWAFFDDLWAASAFNISLVRNSTDFVQHPNIEDAYFIYPFTSASIVIHDTLGPFQSIDTFFITPPSELIDIISTFDSVLLVALQTNATLLTAYKELTKSILDPIPKLWIELNYQYFGGSPMCNTKPATSFVQSTFSFDDVCGQPKPMQLLINPQPALFAYSRLRVAGISALSSCDFCLTSVASCISMTHLLSKLYDGLLANSTIAAIFNSTPSMSDVEIIQFATLNTSSVVLRQSLLQGEWSFFGYVGVYEWVYGHREVISFEGDNQTFAVLSEPLNSISVAPNAIEIPNTTSQYLLATTVTTTAVLVAIAAGTLIFYLRDKSGYSYHLIYYNRIAGPVWLGRPLMLLRSSTAIIILSTSPIVFDTSSGFVRFHFEPRSIFYRLLLASEASWLTDVTTDILLIFTQDIAQIQAHASSMIFWLTIICLESISPIRATAMVDRTCTRVNMEVELTCTSGVVNIGSTSRALIIVGLNFLSIIAGLMIAYACQKFNSDVVKPSTLAMLPAAVLVFCPPKGDAWTMDKSVASMSGIFHFQTNKALWVLDTKTWIIYNVHELSRKVMSLEQLKAPTTTTIAVIKKSSRKQNFMLIAGLLYLVSTVGGSLSYINLARVNFSNDFWWANFNTTGTLTFIANYYNTYRIFKSYYPNVQLDNIAFADTLDYSKINTAVTYTPLYTSIIQFDVVSDISMAIHGLRRTDGCMIPWIATQYCWLDFNRKYSMASTLQRQIRCQKYQTNGAVYLEAPLRNLNWFEFESCWGESFQIAIASQLYDLSWLATIKSNTNSEADEVIYWKSYNITAYRVQWQNYKTIGLIDTFSIENAFGFSYQINLQSTSGIFRLDQETSMKMYWTFARDLWAISLNNSGISGLSLIRESSRFAYQNITPLVVYSTNNTLSSPLSPNFALFATELGPFGSVDLIHVPPPSSLLALTQQILETLSVGLATKGKSSQTAFQALPIMASLMPVPSAILPHFVTGGSFMCDQTAPTLVYAAFGMLLFFASDASCGLELSEMLFPVPQQVLFASIASNLTLDEIPIACSGDSVSPPDCIHLFQSVKNFTTTFLSPTNISLLQQVIQDVASIEIMQYIINTTTSTRELFHQPILDISDPAMILFGWMYLYDWAMGIREVVQLDGDNSTLSIISTFFIPTTFVVDEMEVPKSFSTYCRVLCEYVSYILAVIAIIAGLYSLLNQCTTEGLNLFETNRVGGLVWVGRPLLLVRSLTALAILSTATLELQVIGSVSVLASTRSNASTLMLFLTKFLAAGEVTWLVYIIQDLAMVFTRETTTLYCPISALSTWFVSFCLSIATPVIHQASINRQCSIEIIDYQLVCSSGNLVIGNVYRFSTLIAFSFGISIVFYLYYRYRYPISRYIEYPSSLLSCGGKYLFNRSGWVFKDLYYIDYASAALTGLITIPRDQKLYILDLKTWRILIVDREEILRTNDSGCLHLNNALPLAQ
ncbi:hypothetical protein THRCLA_04606, partial [Thraustotheca clavata]